MRKLLFTTIATGLTALPAWADVAGDWREGYHMWWGWGGMMFGGVMMLLFWIVLIAVIVLAIRWLMQQDGGRPGASPDDEALRILRERFARGEIDEAEFNARRKALTER